MIKFFIAGLFLLLVFCRSANNNIIITGKITPSFSSKIYLYSFTDSLSQLMGNKSIVDSSELDDDGNYFFSIKCNKPNLFDLEIDQQTIIGNLFIKQGDHLILNFFGNEKFHVELKSKEVTQIDFHFQFVDSFYINPEIKHYYYVESNELAIPDYQKYIDERANQEMEFFYNFFKNHRCIKEFDKFIRNEIYYQSVNDKLLLLWKKRMKNLWQRGDTVYEKFVNEVRVENPDAWMSPAYHRFLELYINERYQQFIERKNNSDAEKFSPIEEKQKIVEENLHGIYRDMMILKLQKNSSSLVSNGL